MYKIEAEKLAKRFGPTKVFSDISFELTTGEVIAVVGPNGSGKTTLLKLLLKAGYPSRGTVTYSRDNNPMDRSAIRDATSLVAPYLNLYDNLTGEENIVFFASVGGCQITGKKINQMLSQVGLEGRGSDLVAAYSSGMKQRLKYAVALLSDPACLFLDEPTSNLDDTGKKIVFDLIAEYREKAIIVIATNEKEEQNLADKFCRVAG